MTAEAAGASEITRSMLKILLATSLSFLVLIAMPVALSTARYWEIALASERAELPMLERTLS